MAVDDLFAMDGVHQEQDDNDEKYYHPKNAGSSIGEQQYTYSYMYSTPEEWGNTLEEFVFWDPVSVL